MTHTVTLSTPYSRTKAHLLIDKAPSGYVCTIAAPKRTSDQNAKLWAMLTDISTSKPEGRMMTPDLWKAVFMQACGHEVQFVLGLDGLPFPTGFRSSRLSKAQMGDLITFIQEYGDRHGVRWTEVDCG
jgi:hypothetical protein